MNKHKSTPQVDILLPYWGDFSLLKQAIDSVLAQTSPNWKLIVVDDNYPGNKAALYCKKLDDRRITYIKHKQNIGVTKNFNYCLSLAKSPYFVMFGCDDIMKPTYLERAVSKIGSADFYQPRVDIIDANSKQYLPLADKIKRVLQPRRAGYLHGENLARSLCIGNWLYFPSILWKTSTIQGYSFREEYNVTQDVAVELSMILDGAHLYYDTQTTFLYRRFSASVSSRERRGGRRFGEEARVYRSFVEKFRAKGWYKAAFLAHLRPTSRLHQTLTYLPSKR